MHIVITCGPAYAPIDSVRRITNTSSGRLGAILSDFFLSRGHAVTCFRGEGATFRGVSEGVKIHEFGTNDDLEKALAKLAASGARVDAVLHAAALCDFGIETVRDEAGHPVQGSKLPSRVEGYTLRLKPLPKVIHRLRALFPDAYLIGWKYEMEGNHERIAALGRRQIDESRTNLCVLNGPGWDESGGFGMVGADGAVEEARDFVALAASLMWRIEGL
ncbi:phosphopantothenoylcysteine decarboxylase / phosphopantothenate--cysteine ligase [Verrucomicrobium sp. GAS474]|uniref:phosphopantothenoylcysteine decarboxylase domain-containing protein n=1 Tax=Verrucomicrobium sp. GAS474 TaxID=1882831 RepID=UPI00087B5061|nr:phosphopantothenoylcysteine decarboxylase [Verrucomicrobium sp. GAS474]SDT87656.1 phosphopantothenoylcysteine decarboxylase / phosphopantothenate--cysteine ligase [Verrucomicrobium sp. GAS474]